MLLFGCLFQGLFFLVREIMCKTKKYVYYGHISGSLIINGFWFCYSALWFIHSLDVALYERGNLFLWLWYCIYAQAAAFLKTKLHDCQLGVLTKCVFLGAWKTRGPHNRATSHAILLQQTELAKLSMYQRQHGIGRGRSNWPGVRRKDWRKIKEGIQTYWRSNDVKLHLLRKTVRCGESSG